MVSPASAVHLFLFRVTEELKEAAGNEAPTDNM